MKGNEGEATVHCVGSLGTWSTGITYCFLQSYLTYYMSKYVEKQRKLFYIRITICSIALTLSVVAVVSAILMMRKILPFEENYIWNTIEWLVGCLLMLFTLTFYEEFKSIDLKLILREDIDDYSYRKVEKQTEEK